MWVYLLCLVVWALPSWAGYRALDVVPVDLAALDVSGQVADPSLDPTAGTLGFELLGAAGDTLEVYTAPAVVEQGRLHLTAAPVAVLQRKAEDPFSLGAVAQRPVSEHLTWGPPKRKRPRFAVAATRKASPRGASQVNFDIHLNEPGRVRFLTDHPANDAQPAFRPDGEVLAFTSGRSGQGDIYLYHFFAEQEPVVRLTYEAAGSELYPVWAPGGNRLAYIGHLGGADHIYLVDAVDDILSLPPGQRRQSVARRAGRDLTPGWRVSCLAPAFSPDGKWLAFYAREGGGGRADLYVVPVAGGTPRRLLQGGLPETRGGPRWLPNGEGLIAVSDDAARLNPLLWVPLAEGAPAAPIDTGTELNADPYPTRIDGVDYVLFTAQGGGGQSEKRWRRVYLARLTAEEGQ